MKMKFAAFGCAGAVALAAAVAALGLPAAWAQDAAAVPEAAIRKALAERLAGLPPIDAVSKTPMAGVYEVQVGNELFYTDAEGAYLLRGELLDLKAKRNLTEERMNKINAIDFASLPLKDAIVWKNGSGARKIAVFADPNCGYCKRFEKELSNVKDVTVYTFLIPILGGDSGDKAKAVWCAKDPTAAWRSLMVDNVAPPKAQAGCEAPIERNLAFSRKHKVNGTPAIVFENGTRVPGMLTAPQLEKQFAANAGKS